jgi:hypothetical protein
LWSEEEREKLWGYTLDKEERWIDLRILRREEDGYIHSKEGVRLTPEQLRNMLPILNELLGDIDDAIEKAERENDI